ncbi:hypothetical protein HYT18_01990 [Candidatus Microgenomates bacterium]|nr:hypothetical protein [Candidatus Microgenomates bacterium]
MKTLIAILILASFLQSTILPINLVLIILICRAYIKAEKSNLYLAFTFGLFISHLNLDPLGLQSVVYLLIVQITQGLSRSPFATNYLTIVPISFILLSLNKATVWLITQHSFELMPQVLLESLLSLPILYLVRIWEERFVARKDIKLKV